MPRFINTIDQAIFDFDDDVEVIKAENGTYTFRAPHGALLTKLPATLQPAPDAADPVKDSVVK